MDLSIQTEFKAEAKYSAKYLLCGHLNFNENIQMYVHS